MICTNLRFVTRAATSLVALVLAATTAYAVDGVVLINQSAALNGNVTPGDTPGFPVTISVSGSYRLSSNLTVPDADTTAIKILANEVTIDLNGFSIVGPTVCSAGSCSPLGQGNGVEAFATDVKVFNGNVRGMGFAASSARDNQGGDIATSLGGCVRANNAPEP